MPRRDNSSPGENEKRKGRGAENVGEQQGIARPEIKPRRGAPLQKLQGGGKMSASRQKLPSGPLGGSGRKTNLSRSS